MRLSFASVRLMRLETLGSTRQIQKHLKRGTLFDHFVVTRKQSPAPAFARLGDPKDDGSEAQTVVEQTGAVCCLGSPEPLGPSPTQSAGVISPSVDDFNLSGQSNADVDIGGPVM
jgi:hypothetical protein